MISSSDDNWNTTPGPSDDGELFGLLTLLCDKEISDADFDRLQSILRESPAARRLYLRYQAVHATLAMGAGGAIGCSAVDAQFAVERAAMAQISSGKLSRAVNPCGVLSTTSRRRHSFGRSIRWVASLSAVVLLIACAYWLGPREFFVTTPSAPPELRLADDNPRSAESSLPVAEVSFVSETAAWNNPNSSYALGSQVCPGQTLTLEHGQIELTYETGTKVLLTGPTEFKVRTKGGMLRKGEVVARVTVAGHGFTIETPHGKVVDLGTEFGVVVDDFGVSQVSVFEGKVETLPLSRSGEAGELIELTSGRALQWTEKSVTPIAIQGKRYPIRPVSSHSAKPRPILQGAIDEDFRKTPLAPGQWKTIGVVTATDQGLHLGTEAATGLRPYLLSTREFDPSRGAVNIVCDVRFENDQDAEHASFAILTRSSNKQSKPNLPWSDMLARSFRCRFGTNPTSGEGALEAATKFEADREITNVSWGGFSRPQPNTLYRLEMRDDGLNVTFTVSLVSNPAVRKTISCRSLFRGDENFVALEGSNTGTVIVERLAISQETFAHDDPISLAAGDIANAKQIASEKKGIPQQLAEFAPENAELVLQDDFGGESIDRKLWTTMGNVTLHNGQVQIGSLNAEENINTWRPRPYLLTREHFDPAGGAVTVLGKVTFAENFLHGYGASFAVMTRADQAYGGGPTWERSVLQRGVRFNFWPAAFGFDHSLEIHERSSPDTISLLTATGLSISPQSRCYLFKATDDGRSATLTLLDPEQPRIRKTISHVTTTMDGSSNVIAFESCWGSPVQLDSIRIYRAKTSLSESNPQKH